MTLEREISLVLGHREGNLAHRKEGKSPRWSRNQDSKVLGNGGNQQDGGRYLDGIININNNITVMKATTDTGLTACHYPNHSACINTFTSHNNFTRVILSLFPFYS